MQKFGNVKKMLYLCARYFCAHAEINIDEKYSVSPKETKKETKKQ